MNDDDIPIYDFDLSSFPIPIKIWVEEKTWTSYPIKSNRYHISFKNVDACDITGKATLEVATFFDGLAHHTKEDVAKGICKKIGDLFLHEAEEMISHEYERVLDPHGRRGRRNHKDSISND